MLEIEFFNNYNQQTYLNSTSFKELIQLLINTESTFKKAFISYIFLSDADLLQINKKYLDHNYYTDIITFTLDKTENTIEAELYLSIDRIKENSKDLKVMFKEELLRVAIHGVLHLCGYNDELEDEKILMRKKENEYIQLYVSRET